MRLLHWSESGPVLSSISILLFSAHHVIGAALSVQSTNTSLSTNICQLTIDEMPCCSASLYGYPPWASCRQALANIPDRSRVLQFYQRFPNAGGDVSVPYRWISSTFLKSSNSSGLNGRITESMILIFSVADGNCAIELTLTGGKAQGRASSHDIKTAVNRLITTCVGNHGSGGITLGLGRFLAVHFIHFDDC